MQKAARLLLQQVVNSFLINLLYFYTGFFRRQVKALLLKHGKWRIKGHVAWWVCSKLGQETGWELSLRQIVKILLLAALSAPAKPERKLNWSFTQLNPLLNTLFPKWKAAGFKWNFWVSHSFIEFCFLIQRGRSSSREKRGDHPLQWCHKLIKVIKVMLYPWP